MQPASVQAMIWERAAAMATLRPLEMGPGERFRLQDSSRIARRMGFSLWACRSQSQVPSVEPPSTMMTSAGGGSCASRLGTSLAISFTSLRTVAMMVTGGIEKV